MGRRAVVHLAIQALVLLHVLHSSVSVHGLDVTTNFDNTKLSATDAPVHVSPAKVSNPEIEERDNEAVGPSPVGPSPHPSNALPRPPTAEFKEQHKAFFNAIAEERSASEAGSLESATDALELKPKPPVAPADTDAINTLLEDTSSGSGSLAPTSDGAAAPDAATAATDAAVMEMLAGSGSAMSDEKFKEILASVGDGFMKPDLSIPQNKTIEDDNIIIGELYGGKEHGEAFSDITNIRYEQMLTNMTIRGDKRVDRIGLTMMTEDTYVDFEHGGKGGGMAFVAPELGDTIASIEVHWDKFDDKTCIFYMMLTTKKSQETLSAGTKTGNTAIITPPEGFRIAGLHGRATSDSIFCIGAIFARIGIVDMLVTDAIAVPAAGTPDVYNYKTTIRNWVGPVEIATDNACYQKRVDASSKDMCPSGYRQDDDDCIPECPLNYPVECMLECIPQNSDCTQAVVAKIVSVVSVALNVATMGVFGAFLRGYKTINYVVACAVSIANGLKSLLFYLRYKQVTIPKTDIERLMDTAFQLQIALLDLPMAVCACLVINIPGKLMFSVTVLAIVSAVVMMAVMIGEALFAKKINIILMLRESGAVNGTALNRHKLDLDSFLDPAKNTTCGYEMRTLTNRVIGKVQDVRANTPDADEDDVRVEVSKSPMIMEDIPVITNHCMGEIWQNQTAESAFKTRNLLRKTLGVIIEQLIKDGTTDMGKHVAKKEKALEYSNMGLFLLSMFDPTGIAWMASEFVQPICGPTEYLGEIDDGPLNEALGLNVVDQAFRGSYGIWKKEGNGSVVVYFDSVDKYDVDVAIFSGGKKINDVRVPADGKAMWSATVEELQDRTLYMDRWRPGLFGLPGSGGGSLLLWVPRSSQGGELILHARLNVS